MTTKHLMDGGQQKAGKGTKGRGQVMDTVRPTAGLQMTKRNGGWWNKMSNGRLPKPPFHSNLAAVVYHENHVYAKCVFCASSVYCKLGDRCVLCWFSITDRDILPTIGVFYLEYHINRQPLIP